MTTLNGGIDVAHAVLNGERRALGRPNFAIPAPDGTFYIVYAGQAPLRMAVTLQAYDVSEMPISLFLRTPDNYPKPEVDPDQRRQVSEGRRGLSDDGALL